MPHRYSLRVESGALEGQSFPVQGDPFTVGRKAGSSLQLNDPSVSGAHASLSVDETGVIVRDLGSTNGTRVGSAKILEARLDPGQQIIFGAIQCTLLEGSPEPAQTLTQTPTPASASASTSTSETAPAGIVLEEAAPPPAQETLDGTGVGEHVISAENLARSRKKSPLGTVVLLVLVAAAGGAWWFLGRSGEEGGKGRPVQPLADNLLAEGFSFEAPGSWEALDEGEAAFARSPRARHSGEFGLSASLEPGETAVHASPWVRVRRGRRLLASAQVRIPDSGALRLGIEVAGSEEGTGPGSVATFGPPLADHSSFGLETLAVVVPDGYARARFLLVAEASADEAGRVDVDDAGLVIDGEGEAAAVLDEYRFFEVGTHLNLFKVDATLLSGIRVRPANASSRAAVPLHPAAEAHGVRLAPDLSGPAVLEFLAEARGLEGGVATMGAGGYTLRTVDFEAEGVTDLILGKGVNLIRLSLGEASTVRGRQESGAFRLRVDLSAAARPLIQVRFKDERTAAINLAADAEAAERAGRLGECLALWQTMLNTYPFEESLVKTAESVRARLLVAGYEQARALEGDIERAHFFRLVGLYRECRREAEDIAERFGGSEVEDGALRLVERVDADLAVLESDLDRREVQRLTAILKTLEAEGAEGLAERMKQYLATEFAVASTNGGER